MWGSSSSFRCTGTATERIFSFVHEAARMVLCNFVYRIGLLCRYILRCRNVSSIELVYLVSDLFVSSQCSFVLLLSRSDALWCMINSAIAESAEEIALLYCW
jgi:hypothetical protein